MAKDTIYRINFINQGEVYEVYARHVSQGGLFGFVEIEGIVFGERSKILIDSSDEVEKAGRGRITSGDGKVATFPMAIMPPGGKKGDS